MNVLKVAIGIAVLSAAPASAQNLLVNPGFDVADQLDGWTCTLTYGTATWNAEDRQAQTTSGSMQHDVNAWVDSQKVRCHQCVAVEEGKPYVASVWHYWPDDPDVNQLGSTRISYEFFGDVGCTTNLGVYDVQVDYPHLDTWSQLVSDEVVSPAGAQSAAVYVFTWQNNADDPVRARLDDIRFSVSPGIFSDDFEDGDLWAWSTWVP
jgi:hypothetical protein